MKELAGKKVMELDQIKYTLIDEVCSMKIKPIDSYDRFPSIADALWESGAIKRTANGIEYTFTNVTVVFYEDKVQIWAENKIGIDIPFFEIDEWDALIYEYDWNELYDDEIEDLLEYHWEVESV